MAVSNLSYGRFALVPEAANNEIQRIGALVFEYFQTAITISTNEGTVEVATNLSEVLGLVDLSYMASCADPTDTIKLMTDGIISTGAVTVTAKSVDVTDGSINIRGFLVGTMNAPTKLTSSDNLPY